MVDKLVAAKALLKAALMAALSARSMGGLTAASMDSTMDEYSAGMMAYNWAALMEFAKVGS